MPHRAGDDKRNVLLNEMNKPFADYALSGDLSRWEQLRLLRDDVNGALEKARADKKIGKSLEAHVTLVKSADSQVELEKTLDAFGAQLPDLFIVSDVEVSRDAALYAQGEDTSFDGWRVAVSEAKGEKCPRCWKHSTSANADGLCPRCAEVVAKLPKLD